MGLCNKDLISIVGNYLVAELKTKGTVRFSRFCGSADAAEAWRREAGLSENENDDKGPADLAMGYAIFQLEDAGHIATRAWRQEQRLTWNSQTYWRGGSSQKSLPRITMFVR